MADELRISAIFDAGDIFEGLEQFTAAIKEAAEVASGSFKQIEASSTLVSDTVKELYYSGTEASQGVGELNNALQQLYYSGTQAEQSISSETELLQAFAASVAEATGTVAELVVAETQLATLAEAQSSALVGEGGQLQLFAEAAATATGQLLLFEQVQFGTAAAAEAQVAATAEATATLDAMTVTLSEGVSVSKSMEAALELLSSKEAIAASTSEEYAAALAVVTNNAAKLGLELKQTAAGLVLVNAETQQGAAKMSQMDGVLANATGRMGAMELGAGKMSYAIGQLARSSSTLGPILATAFPIVFAIALVDVLDSAYQKLEQLGNEIRKTGLDWIELGASIERSAEATELNNLKMQDTIDKLEGRPASNRLSEALLENKLKADQLNKSLSDAFEKATELLTLKGVTAWGELFSGVGSTQKTLLGQGSDITEQLKQPLVELATAQKEVLAAETEEERKAADAAVAIANQKVHDIAKIEKDRLNESKSHELSVVGKNFIPPDKGGESQADQDAQKAKQIAEINLFYSAQQDVLNGVIATTKAYTEAKNASTTAEKLNLEEKRKQDEAEGRSRDFTVSEGSIKANEKLSQQEFQSLKKSDDDRIREEEATARNEAAIGIEAGDNKLQNELQLNSKLRAIRAGETIDQLNEHQLTYESQKEILLQQQRLVEQDKVGPERVAKLKQINADLDALEEQNIDVIKSIRQNGEIALLTLDTEAANKRTEIAHKASQDQVFAAREETRHIIDEARNEANEKAAVVKAGASIELQIIDYRESSHLITVQEATNARIAAYKNEEQQLVAILENEKTKLLAQRDALKASIEVTKDPVTLKELQRIYDQLTEAVNKLTSAEKGLNTQLGHQTNATQIAGLKTLQQQYERTFQTIGDKAAGMFNSMIGSGTHFKQAWNQMVIQLEQEMVSALFRMLAKHLAIEFAKSASTAASQVAQTGATAAGEAARTGIVAAGAASQNSIGLLAGLKSILHAAARAAAWAYTGVMEHVPFPLNVALAPVAAAGTFVAVAAYQTLLGSAEKGALLADDTMLMAHAKEMVLPSHLSIGLQSMISDFNVSKGSGVSFGGGDSTQQGLKGHINLTYAPQVKAFDGYDAQKVIERQAKTIGQITRPVIMRHLKGKI